MKTRNPRRAVSLQIALTAIMLGGCRPAQQPKPAAETAKPDAGATAEDARSAAETALGGQAEVLARGDLARNGLEQMLVINRFASALPGGAGKADGSAIFITRATILEKSKARWIEVLRCDEHLKNPNGYLGGSLAAPVTGWRLQYRTDTPQGLEMKFTPANFATGEPEAGKGEPAGQTFVVRWNTQAKRYQSLDASQERYLSEAPMLEIPHSILR